MRLKKKTLQKKFWRTLLSHPPNIYVNLRDIHNIEFEAVFEAGRNLEAGGTGYIEIVGLKRIASVKRRTYQNIERH